jgi:hypothetical protein
MAPNTSQPELLTSWKEIANYLGKGVRTVQRWELQFGLPVRRPNEKVKGIVHATRQELDRWLEVQWSQRPKDEHPIPVRLNGDHVQVSHASIEHAARLRQENRLLLEDLRTSLGTMFAQCEAIARTMADVRKTR